MKQNERTADTILREANDFFNAQGVSVIGRGYEEIATNRALFESYVEMLTEGAGANTAAQMAQLMENTNAQLLHETSMTGIAPISSLSMPVIRKLWPKFALKDAIKTEVAKTPYFSVLYSKPYMYKGDSEKIYLPRGLNHDGRLDQNGDTEGYGDHTHSAALSKSYTVEHKVVLTSGAAKVEDFVYENGTSGVKDTAVEIVNTPSTAKLQPLDELVFIKVEVAEKGAEGTGKEYFDATTPSIKVVKIGKKLDVTGSGVFELGAGNGQLIVKFEGAARRATFAYVGATDKAVRITVKAGVSSEFNEDSYSIALDILRQDITIPTGTHINAPLPIEALNDMMNLYQIDGTKEVVDVMTNYFAQQLDIEILDFIRKSLVNRPGNEEFADYGDASKFAFVFDCKPAAGFAGSPKAWREELKPLIDFLAQSIKNETYFQGGTFTIVANPLDVNLLTNVDWQFRGGQGGNLDGVEVDYSVGSFVGANAYKVIASVNVPAGAMYVLFTPSTDSQMTYKYYPYTFSTEMGYTDPNRSRVPSIMMTARRTMYEFMPAIGCIIIKNNDGKNYFSSYVATKAVTE